MLFLHVIWRLVLKFVRLVGAWEAHGRMVGLVMDVAINCHPPSTLHHHHHHHRPTIHHPTNTNINAKPVRLHSVRVTPPLLHPSPSNLPSTTTPKPSLAATLPPPTSRLPPVACHRQRLSKTAHLPKEPLAVIFLLAPRLPPP
jgi:hypothetical protein